jgi:hypothetical protein
MAASPPTDLELMMLADGELEPGRAREVAAAAERDPTAKAKLAGLAQVGAAVKATLEGEAAHAEADVPEFADMWGHIERKLAAPERDEGEDRVRVPPARAPSRSNADALGGWASARAWLSGHRGHMLSGLVSAGAVAGIMLWLRPPGAPIAASDEAAPSHSAPIRATVVASAPPCTPAGAVPLAPAAPPEVEDFEVYGGSGMVFTLPSEGAGDSSATVIWIDKDQATAEAPI